MCVYMPLCVCVCVCVCVCGCGCVTRGSDFRLSIFNIAVIFFELTFTIIMRAYQYDDCLVLIIISCMCVCGPQEKHSNLIILRSKISSHLLLSSLYRSHTLNDVQFNNNIIIINNKLFTAAYGLGILIYTTCTLLLLMYPSLLANQLNVITGIISLHFTALILCLLMHEISFTVRTENQYFRRT